MKILQTRLLKIVVTFILFFSVAAAHAQPHKILFADSLFRTKQYTQSMALYQKALEEKKYSPAMLLKMAFIQEGLGRVGATLYYLKLYYLASEDEQALQKMEELAAKFKLSGYSSTDADRVKQWISKNSLLIQCAIAGFIFLIFFMVFLRWRKNKAAWPGAFIILITVASLGYLNNFYSVNTIIVGHDRTYLMEAPSAGARVAGIISEGNQLESLGHDDVWLKVRWMDKVAYVKINSVLTITL